MESTSVVVVGAGFSAAATNGKLPLMTGFFDRLKKEGFPELYDFVTEVGCHQLCKRIQDANVERVLIALDQIRTSPAAALRGWLDRWKEKFRTIQEQLSYYTLHRLRDSLQIEENNWAVRLLAGCGLETTVISMNYDNIAEQILSNRPGMRHGEFAPTCPHCKMRLLLQRACSCDSRTELNDDSWRGSLIKPHGSIAWKRCINPICCSFECLVADERCRPFEPCKCPNCEADCSPVLVMPTMSKNLEDLPEISTMWQAARLALCKAESLLFFGFSLPTSDELLVQLIRCACKEGGALRRVGAIDLDPEGVLDRFQSCLPDGYEVETTAFPVERGQPPTWLETTGEKTLLRSTA
jgi:NAD-dependent SIR2 family protein deacetylase